MTRVLAPVCRAPGVQRRRRAPVTLTRVKHGRVVAASRKVRFSSIVRRAGDEPPKPPLADADASIEPCLVGWTDVDENGTDVYCCEQPGGAIQCKTIEASPEHEECELMEQPEAPVACELTKQSEVCSDGGAEAPPPTLTRTEEPAAEEAPVPELKDEPDALAADALVTPPTEGAQAAGTFDVL